MTTQQDDFVITGSIIKYHHLVATAVADAQRTPSALIPGGIFLTRTYTRLAHADEEGEADDNR